MLCSHQNCPIRKKLLVEHVRTAIGDLCILSGRHASIIGCVEVVVLWNIEMSAQNCPLSSRRYLLHQLALSLVSTQQNRSEIHLWANYRRARAARSSRLIKGRTWKKWRFLVSQFLWVPISLSVDSTVFCALQYRRSAANLQQIYSENKNSVKKMRRLTLL